VKQDGQDRQDGEEAAEEVRMSPGEFTSKLWKAWFEVADVLDMP
jgi:hypothetical protein